MVTLYSRPAGPVCYEAQLFGDADAVRRLPIQLLSSGLSWYWASARLRPLEDNSEFRERPPERRLTIVTSETAQELVDDLSERDVDGYGRSILLVGVDSAEALTLKTSRDLHLALESFSTREAGPIRILIVQLGDSPEYVFVPHARIQPVARLLETWGITSERIAERRSYKRLNLVKLESLLPGIFNHAFGETPALQNGPKPD